MDSSETIEDLYNRFQKNIDAGGFLPDLKQEIFKQEILLPFISDLNLTTQSLLEDKGYWDFNIFLGNFSLPNSPIKFSPYTSLVDILEKLFKIYQLALDNAEKFNCPFMVDEYHEQLSAILLQPSINYYFLANYLSNEVIEATISYLPESSVDVLFDFITKNIPSGVNICEKNLESIFETVKNKINTPNFTEFEKNRLFDIFVLKIVHYCHIHNYRDYIDLFSKYLSESETFLSLEHGIQIKHQTSTTFAIEIDYRCFSKHFLLSASPKLYSSGVILNRHKINSSFLDKLSDSLKLLEKQSVFTPINYELNPHKNGFHSNILVNFTNTNNNVDPSFIILFKKIIEFIYESEILKLRDKKYVMDNTCLTSIIHEYSLRQKISDDFNLVKVKRKI